MQNFLLCDGSYLYRLWTNYYVTEKDKHTLIDVLEFKSKTVFQIWSTFSSVT